MALLYSTADGVQDPITLGGGPKNLVLEGTFDGLVIEIQARTPNTNFQTLKTYAGNPASFNDSDWVNLDYLAKGAIIRANVTTPGGGSEAVVMEILG